MIIIVIDLAVKKLHLLYTTAVHLSDILPPFYLHINYISNHINLFTHLI